MYECWHSRTVSFFPKFNHSSPLPVCLRFVIFTYEACACARAALYFVMSSAGFLTPWDWSDPELSDLCLSSTCARSNTHTHVKHRPREIQLNAL